MGINICGCNNGKSIENETNIVIIKRIININQYSNDINKIILSKNDLIQTQSQEDKFINNWSIYNFNELPLIQRITIIHQVNKIIKAFRYYASRKNVSKYY